MRAVMLAALAHIASLVGVVALLVHSTAAVLAQPLYCSTWNGVTTCSSPGGYVGHESTWQGVTAGDDNQGNRWTTSRWQGIELRSSSSETTGAIAAHLRRLDPIDRSSRLVGPINPDGVAALAQTGERGSRRVRQPAGGGDKLVERSPLQGAPAGRSLARSWFNISGYTNFVSGVELDHAQDIIADIMDTLVIENGDFFEMGRDGLRRRKASHSGADDDGVLGDRFRHWLIAVGGFRIPLRQEARLSLREACRPSSSIPFPNFSASPKTISS